VPGYASCAAGFTGFGSHTRRGEVSSCTKPEGADCLGNPSPYWTGKLLPRLALHACHAGR